LDDQDATVVVLPVETTEAVVCHGGSAAAPPLKINSKNLSGIGRSPVLAAHPDRLCSRQWIHCPQLVAVPHVAITDHMRCSFALMLVKRCLLIEQFRDYQVVEKDDDSRVQIWLRSTWLAFCWSGRLMYAQRVRLHHLTSRSQSVGSCW
jgi:hypothetical protein